MTESNKNAVCTLCDKVGLKPLTRENVFNFYVPLHGVLTYGALAVNVMNPTVAAKILPKKDISNILLLTTIVGTSFYIYGRPQLKSVPNSKRGAYAILGATLFSLGSVLGWALIKSNLPKNNSLLATLAGVGSGALAVKLSIDYFNDTKNVQSA